LSSWFKGGCWNRSFFIEIENGFLSQYRQACYATSLTVAFINSSGTSVVGMTEDETTFECLRCGRCCSSLLSEDQGILRGLTLLPEEHEQFPQPVVRPAIGIGRRPHERGFRIIAYQLTEDTCPHLEGSSCGIYSERPASCRQFPFSLRRSPEGMMQMGFDLNCPALQGILENNLRLSIRFEARPYAEKLQDIQREAAKRPSRAWHFDLRTGSWIRYRDMPKI
jgi:Fe-S-cluster containining protein